MPVEKRQKQAEGWTSTTKVLVGLTALGGLVFLGSVGLLAWLIQSSGSGDVVEGSYLTVAVTPSLQDAPGQPSPFDDPSDVPPLLTEVADAVRSAATDDRIQGLFLRVDGLGVGWGATGELRSAVEAFSASGKPCVAWAESYDTRAYYLASACEKVVLAPGGLTLVNGLAMNITYYAGTFEKVGVDAEFEHVGDFKSAVEPYERSGPSEAASVAMDAVLDSLWSDVLADIARGRKITPEEVQARIDQPALSPNAALSSGLVDALGYKDAVLAHLASSREEGFAEKVAQIPDKELERPELTPVAEYVKDRRAQGRRAGQQVAVVHASGPIVSGDGDGGLFGDSMLGDVNFRRWMKDARDDDAVKAVVLRVDSPGGSGLASDMMWREIKLTQAAGKPVVVSMADYAASGGYYIAAPADWVVSNPLTLTGSIGVFGGKLNLGGLYEKLGMTNHAYKRGSEADLFSESVGFSEQGRASFRVFLQDFYDLFLSRVAEGRELSKEAVHEVAQGRVWTGRQAMDRDLVDEIGGLQDAVRKAGELAGVAEYGIARYPEQKPFFELLMEDLRPDPSVLLPLGLEAELHKVQRLQRILEGGGVAAFLPGDLLLN